MADPSLSPNLDLPIFHTPYLAEHPELFDQAAEIVQRDPDCAQWLTSVSVSCASSPAQA